MSVKVMGAVWDADLGRYEKYILLAYADHAEHDGSSVYPSVGLIAWKTGYSERQVIRITKILVKKGYLIHYGESKFGTNLFRIDLESLPQREDYSGVGRRGRPPENPDTLSKNPDKMSVINEENPDTLSKGGDISAKKGDISAENPDIAMSPDSSFNRHLKPSEEPKEGEGIPDHLDTPEFLKTWSDFQEHRRQIKKKMTDLAKDRMLKKLGRYPVEIAINMLDTSIENGWQGVFEPKEYKQNGTDKSEPAGYAGIRAYMESLENEPEN